MPGLWVQAKQRVRKQAVLSAKLERHTRAYKCTSFTEKLLPSKDCPEIHPPMFCSKCQLVLRRKIAAQKEKRTYKCLLKPYDWFRWVQGMNRSSNCHISFYHMHSKVVYKDRWPKYRPYSGNS